jgi:hypothetical protein
MDSPDFKPKRGWIFALSVATLTLTLFALGRQALATHGWAWHVAERVSVSAGRVQGNADSRQPDISDDGRYVAFLSLASTLVDGDTNSTYDVFVHDRMTGVTERVSVASDGSQGNSSTSSTSPSISSEGRYVAFASIASNLVLDDTNGLNDDFVHDRMTGVTERVSVASDGSQGEGGGSQDRLRTPLSMIGQPGSPSLFRSGPILAKLPVTVSNMRSPRTPAS